MAFSANDAKLSQTSDSMFSGYLLPEQAQDYFALAERISIVQQFARKIPMGPTGVKIPHWTGDVSAAWVGEGEMKPITKGDLSSQTVSPHKIATIFVASAEVVRANPAGYLTTMRQKVATAIASAFDDAVLHGTDSPFASSLDDTTKTQFLSAGTAYDALAVDGLGQLANDGKYWSATVLDNTVEPILNGAKDNNGRPLFLEQPFADQAAPLGDGSLDSRLNNQTRRGRIVGRPTILSKYVASGNTIGYQGDFDQIVWGQVGGLSYDATNQATLNFGTAESPNLVSLWQHNLFAVLVEAEFGLLINDTDSFVKLVTGPLSYTLTVSGQDTGGTFTLKVNGVETGTVTAATSTDTTATLVKNAIVAVDDGIVAADVTVTGSNGGPFTVSGPFTLSHGTDNVATTTVVAA